MTKFPDFGAIPFHKAANPGQSGYDAWKANLERETGKSFEANIFRTMEQINLDPLYDERAYKDFYFFIADCDDGCISGGTRR